MTMTRRFLTLSLLALAVGCEQKPTQRELKPLDAAPQAEQSKIQEAVTAAGIKNPVLVIKDAGDQWVCTIAPDGTGPKGEPPPGRPIPEEVMVHKTTYKVTRTAQAPGRKESKPVEGEASR
jgi:hypothetical protein